MAGEQADIGEERVRNAILCEIVSVCTVLSDMSLGYTTRMPASPAADTENGERGWKASKSQE